MITGKVARILGDEEVVLNVGSEDGVEEDMEFVIFSESDHIIDPDTGEDLGAIEIVKGRVKVYHVMEKMSLARTLTYQVRVPSPYERAFLGMGRLLAPDYETRASKLEVLEDQVRPLEEDLGVRLGDKVRSV